MILLSIYAATILFYCLAMFCFMLEIALLAKEKGYEIPNEGNKIKVFIALFKILIIGCIPIYNVILGFLLLFSDEVKNNTIEKHIIKKGVKSDDNL